MAIKQTLDKENSKKIIASLIEKYKKVIDEKKANNYNEEMTKKDFILPLFSALGWNTEDSNEVTAEEKISKKRVDYGFKLNGIPKFFLECKKLKEDLLKTEFVEQAINYSWNKGCTWAILTNFETLAIFNAEWKSENLWHNRFRTFTCDEFLDRFDELWLLSKESFDKNLIDKEAEKVGKKVKKTSVDKQLLYDFTRFRELLSKNITKLNQNKNINEYELDESVQRILDRLIFIRNCEDRELEPRILIANYREWDTRGKGQLVKSLRDTFKIFDGLYNSKIFAEHLCDKLDIDGEVLREIIEGLYYTKDKSVSYDFSAMDADVLGTIYEQYLGHILTKTEKRATITENHIHKKEQGIFYTPTFIVDYIVRNTVGELLKTKKVNVEEIRILDPACGSGSFLIKAFDVLNEYQSKNDLSYHQAELDFKTDTIFTKKAKILQNNIFGVDLDKQAVEIAQLNLLLKIAEKKKRLPLLGENIKCGNSLIADEKYAGDKAFTWDTEFADIFKQGGFDVVIGNPPYVRQEEILSIKPYLEENYEVYNGVADLYVYFIEQGIKLLKDGGYFGIIVSNKWLKAGYGKNLRTFLSRYEIEQFIDFGDLSVFKDATTYPCIIIIRKISENNLKMKVCNINTLNFKTLENYITDNFFIMNQKGLNVDGWSFINKSTDDIINKINKQSIKLSDYIKDNVNRGIVTGYNEAFIIDKKTRDYLIKEDVKNNEIIKPFISGNELKRYHIKSKDEYVIFTRRGIDINKYPSIKRYLEKFKPDLMPKKTQEEKRGRKPGDYEWFEIQDSTAYYEDFDKPKIIYGEVQVSPKFTYDSFGLYLNKTIFFIPTKDLPLLGVLNSRLFWFLITHYCNRVQGGYILSWKYLRNIPVLKKLPKELGELVENMLSINEKIVEMGDKRTDDKIKLEEQKNKINDKIDELVYTIYDISKDEKEIIEKSTKMKT